MKPKKKKDRHNSIVVFDAIYINAIQAVFGPVDDGHAISEFVHAKTVAEQMTALKMVGSMLIEGLPCDQEKVILEVLVNGYLSCHNKNVTKKAIVSCLQSLQECEAVWKLSVSCLQSQVIGLMLGGGDRSAVCRVLDNLHNLTDRFPLGEHGVQGIWKDVIIFLCKTLQRFGENVRSCGSAVLLSELMYDTLAAVQVWNKLWQRSEAHIRQTLVNNSHHNICSHIVNSYKAICDILCNDQYVMDVHNACGMAIPIIIKVLSPEGTTVQQILQHMFVSYDECDTSSRPALLCELDLLPSVSVVPSLCLCGGCLAMLDAATLCSQYKPTHSLLTSVIGKQLISLSTSLEDTNSKLMASRTMVLWATMACQCVEQNPDSIVSGSLHGDSEVPQKLLQFAWTHWEDPVDSIRHQARGLFEKLLKCHLLATKEVNVILEARESVFVRGLMESLMEMGWHMKGKYGPLCGLVEYVTATSMLQMSPTLPQDLLQACREQVLVSHANELLEKLFVEHKKELQVQGDSGSTLCGQGDGGATLCGQGDGGATLWYRTWVDPTLQVLCTGTSEHRTHLIEYTVPKLLKCNPKCVKYITEKLSNSKGHNNLGALVTCLKRAKMMGILKQISSDDQIWNDVVPMATIKEALCHPEEQVRLDAFGLLCENHKTTEVIPQGDLDLVTFFLPLNMSSQTPPFRQTLVALLKKLFIRLKEGGQALNRKSKSGPQESRDSATRDLHRYRRFLLWLIECQFEFLHPEAAFPSRTTALSTLEMLQRIMGSYTAPDRSAEFMLWELMTPDHVVTLMECLSDTFENNKQEAYTILSGLPNDSLTLQDSGRVRSLFEACLELASSTRPQDCTTAAYLLRLLLTQPLLQEVTKKIMHDLTITQQTVKTETDKVGASGMLCVLQIFLYHLQDQLRVARKSLIHAAATRPLYPMMHCIRYILTNSQLWCEQSSAEWREFISSLIAVSFEVAEVVSPVVSHASPEGNVPVEPNIGPQVSVEALAECEEDQELASSTKTVNLMPEYLVVCCWRSIKEVSLLLGQITQMAPLVSPHGDQVKGLITVEQLHDLGDYFTVQLLESRHRGAFELAYAGFVKMTEMLWKCRMEEVHGLPRQWLEDVMSDIRSCDPNSRLCSTRRSAGVPFYVQALVSTEPVTGGRACLKQIMIEMLALAQPPPALKQTEENTAQVHSLNVLRALYKDTRLSEDVFPFIADGLKAAIVGYASQFWMIRNSATLLFSALMTRIFGVKRTKDDMSKKNCLTGRVFFHRFPSMFPFLLEHLTAATENIGGSGAFHLHPGLYPVLMVLGRLFPSVIEGADSTLNLAAFIPHVVTCAASPVYKTRIMAARAIHPLVGKDHIVMTLTSILKDLPRSAGTMTSHNIVHGLLLQVGHIIDDLEGLQASMLIKVAEVIFPVLFQTSWLAESSNKCLLTKSAYMDVTFKMMTFPWPPMTSDLDLKHLESTVIGHIETDLFLCEAHPSTPWLTQYMESLVPYLVSNYREDDQTEQLVKCVVKLCQSDFYEVRLKILELLEESCVGQSQQEDKRSRNWDIGVKVISKNVMASESIFGQLITMVMGQEQHPDCLAKVLSVLCHHPMSNQLPWKQTDGSTYSHYQVMQHLLALQESHRDELRCAAHELSGVVFSSFYELSSQSGVVEGLLQVWLGLLSQRSVVQESVEARHTCASVISTNAVLLLVDMQSILGERVFDVWMVVMRLLQDEDCDVRDKMAAIVLKLQPYISQEEQNGVGSTVGVQCELSVEICLSAMVSIHRGRHWSQCLVTLLTWITTDLEPDWTLQEEKEVRLFDKGEMNTYRDQIIFISKVKTHLTAMVTEVMGHDSSAMDKPSQHHQQSHLQLKNKKQIIDQNFHVILQKLEEHISSVEGMQGKGVYVEVGVYGRGVVEGYRLLTAAGCLAAGCRDRVLQVQAQALLLQDKLYAHQTSLPNTLFHSVCAHIQNSLL